MPDNTAYFRRMLNSIENHIDAVRKAHIENTRRRDLFEMAKTDKDLAQRLDALRGRGVRFLICANTLRERKIDWHTSMG